MIDKVLDLYQEYTGKVLSETQRETYAPFAMRAIYMMASRLGWPLDGGSDAVDVIGVSTHGCACDIFSRDLGEAPTKVGIYRMFPLDSRLPNVLTDPFKKVNHVYIARVAMETENDDETKNGAVILKEVTDVTPIFFQGNCGRYIKACHQMSACQQACEPSCTNCASLLVDANWITIDDLPPELIFLLCDYIDWVADGGLESRSVKTESVDGHSVSYGSWLSTAPYYNGADVAILKTYMGPYGAFNRKMIR